MLPNAVQPLKALLPILAIVVGKEILISEVQFLKTFCPILITPSLIVMVFIYGASKYDHCALSVISPYPDITSVLSLQFIVYVIFSPHEPV